jgi:hypothetical protein
MLTIEQIRDLQKGYNVTNTQQGIESGDIWKFEGSVGRFAMTCLEAGICFLGEDVTYDYYGNAIPARQMLDQTSKGSLENAQEFWQRVYDGEFETIEALEEMFGVIDNEDEIA